MAIQTADSLTRCPESLSEEQVAQFREDGFLAFDALLTSEEAAEAGQAMYEFVAKLHRQAISGEAKVTRGNWEKMRNYSGISISHDDPYYSVLLEPDVDFDVTQVSADEIDRNFRKLSSYSDHHPVFKRIINHPFMRRIIDDLIGPEHIVYGNMALSKPARIGVAKPWHQDMAYFDYLPLHGGAHVWIAIDDATAENGCMIVLPGGHKLGPKMHVHRDDCTIEAGRVDYSSAIPVELKAGGVLFFSPMLPHQTRPNLSPNRRRSLQYFFRGADTKIINRDEYAKHFVDENGESATCHAAALRKKQKQD